MVYAKKTSAGYLINSDLKRFYNDEPNEKKRLDSMVLVNGCVLSERIRNQKGDFILYYTDGDIKENRDFVIKEIPISPDSIEDLKRELRLIGISKSTIYPALTEETKKLKDQLKTIARQKALKEKMKVFSKARQNSGELVSEVLSDKEKIPRKYLDKKKMFAEINLNNNRHGKWKDWKLAYLKAKWYCKYMVKRQNFFRNKKLCLFCIESEKLQILCRDKKELRYVKVE